MCVFWDTSFWVTRYNHTIQKYRFTDKEQKSETNCGQGLSLFLKNLICLFYVSVCFVWSYSYASSVYLVLQQARKMCWIPWNWSYSCEPLYRCWKSSPNPSKEEPVLLNQNLLSSPQDLPCMQRNIFWTFDYLIILQNIIDMPVAWLMACINYRKSWIPALVLYKPWLVANVSPLNI